MMALHENETKYKVMALLDHEMGYDDTMHHTFDWDWDRNSSHTGLIEEPLTSDNPAYLRDKIICSQDNTGPLQWHSQVGTPTRRKSTPRCPSAPSPANKANCEVVMDEKRKAQVAELERRGLLKMDKNSSTLCLPSSGRSSRCTTTVFQPFAGMEIAEVAWKAKVQAEKEREENKARSRIELEKERRHRFERSLCYGKAFKGVIARSEDMCHRRQQAIEEKEEMELRVLKEMAKFKAKPPRIENEELAALKEKGNIFHAHRWEMKSYKLRQESKTGLQMAVHYKLPVRAPNAAKGEIFRNVGKEQRGGAPSTTKPSPKNVRRVLERRQRQWEARLKETKKHHKPVIAPKQLPLEKREEAYRMKAKARSKACALKEQEQVRKEAEAIKRERERAMNVPVPPSPRTTYSQVLKAKAVGIKIKERCEIAEKENMEEKERLRKQREINVVVTKVLKMAELEAKGDNTYISERLSQYENARDAEEQCKTTLQSNKNRLKHLKKARPSLIERHNIELRKETARREALCVIASSVYGGRQDWAKAAIMKDGLFDEEEAAFLLVAMGAA